jgi:hypothetical protein
VEVIQNVVVTRVDRFVISPVAMAAAAAVDPGPVLTITDGRAIPVLVSSILHGMDLAVKTRQLLHPKRLLLAFHSLIL